MPKLTVTIGLPGSGKSYWAAQQDAVVVTKDDIRRELEASGWRWSKESENFVVAIRDARILAALMEGKDVISADTNLAPKHNGSLRKLADLLKADFCVKSFVTVPIEVCVERDAQRTGKARVGEKVIRDMAEANFGPQVLLAKRQTPQLFVDLDGVLADFDGFIEKEFGIVNNRDNERPDFWDIVRGYTGRLYYDMAPLPYAVQLWKALKPFNPVILTGVPWSIENAASDKRQWVKENIDPEARIITCRSRSKSKYALPGDILLDDWTKYQELWEGVGGIFVHHTDPDKSIEEVKRLLG